MKFLRLTLFNPIYGEAHTSPVLVNADQIHYLYEQLCFRKEVTPDYVTTTETVKVTRIIFMPETDTERGFIDVMEKFSTIRDWLP